MSFSGKLRGGGTPATAVEEMGVSVGESAFGIATPVRLLLSTLTENEKALSLAPALWYRQGNPFA